MDYYVCDGNGAMTLFSFMGRGSVEDYITKKYGSNCNWGAITQIVDERGKHVEDEEDDSDSDEE